VTSVYNLISHGIGTESALIEKFTEFYQDYMRLKERGLSYTLPLPEVDFPEYLFCPLRQDKFVDPVITKCRHTFSHKELLSWLSTNRSCPTCRERVIVNDLRANLSIREAIEEFEEKRLEQAKRTESPLSYMANFARLSVNERENKLNQLSQEIKQREEALEKMKKEMQQKIHDLEILRNTYNENISAEYQVNTINVVEDSLLEELEQGTDANAKDSEEM